MQEKTESQLWTEYREGGRDDARNRLIELFMPLVRKLAHRLSAKTPASVDSDDLRAAGVLGLIEAIRSFDPGRGVRFATFAAKRIRGEMVELLRQADFVPVAARRKAAKVELARLEHTDTAGHLDEDAAAEALGVSREKFEKWNMDRPGAGPCSLDDEREDIDGEMMVGLQVADYREPAPDFSMARSDLLGVLMRGFDDQDRRLIHLRYYESMTFGEIGEELGFGQSWVSDRHAKLLAAMRSRAELRPRDEFLL